MQETDIEKLKYPIGKFQRPAAFLPDQASTAIQSIETFPSRLISIASGISKADLEKTYRPGSWTVQQLLHHCADSHMNAFVRFKLALTEETPTIKPYIEERWALLPDTTNAPVQASFQILEGLHVRWTVLLRSLNEKDMMRKYFHPEQNREVYLFEVLQLYAWHAEHHLAHVKQALNLK